MGLSDLFLHVSNRIFGHLRAVGVVWTGGRGRGSLVKFVKCHFGVVWVVPESDLSVFDFLGGRSTS